MTDYPTQALQDALQILADSRLPPAALDYLRARGASIDTELTGTVLAEIPAFSASMNPDVLPDLAEHGPRHTAEILRLLDGGAIGDFEFVREHAERRAEQRFPLEATLHAYRCAHRVFSRWMREATLATLSSTEEAQRMVAAVADFAIEYTDTISTVAAGAYVAQTRLLADVAGDQRAELLALLLEGYDESDGRVAKILGDAGFLDRRQSFCVVLAQPVDPTEMINPARARRLADAIGHLFRRSRVRRLIDVRHDKVTMIFSDTRRASGWTAPNTSLATRLTAELALAGNAVLIGVSNDVPSTASIPNAYSEALLALEMADVTHRVMQFSDIHTRRLLLHFAGDEFGRVLPPWSQGFRQADAKADGALVATLNAYADENMNILKAAKRLSLHPNTIYARLQRVVDLTGLEPRSFHDLTELLVVADCARQSPRLDPERARHGS